MIEYWIILLYKYKVKQTEVISRLLITFLHTNYKNVLHFPNTFSYFFYTYDTRVYSITF